MNHNIPHSLTPKKITVVNKDAEPMIFSKRENINLLETQKKAPMKAQTLINTSTPKKSGFDK